MANECVPRLREMRSGIFMGETGKINMILF